MARILVADDEPSLASAVSRFLQREGHEVLVASDGAAALELLRQHTVDLTIVDIFMPNLDGMELTAHLKRETPAAKIIAVSGGGILDTQDVLEIARRFGATRTLSKPFTLEELSSVVQEVLEEVKDTPHAP